jgi:hypothetical protein
LVPVTFPTDFCPLCGFKLQFEVEKPAIPGGGHPWANKLLTTYFCDQGSFDVKLMNSYVMQAMTRVYHYTHREYTNGPIIEIIIMPYLIRHCPNIDKTRLYYLPEGDEPMQFIAQTGLIKNLDYTNSEQVVDKLKKLTLFS